MFECMKVCNLQHSGEPPGSKFPRRERALGGNPQARTPTNKATSRLGGRAPKRRSPWGMLVQESFHPQLISTDMADKHKLLFQTINNIQKMKQVMITTVQTNRPSQLLMREQRSLAPITLRRAGNKHTNFLMHFTTTIKQFV
jgi:hypothetical protein